MFAVLVRARWRMAWNAARAAPPWHRAVLAVLSLFTLGLFALIAACCAALVLLTQGGARSALTPATHSLIGHIFEYVFFFLLAGSVPFVAATLFQAGDLTLLLATPAPPRALVAAKLLDAALANAGPAATLGVPALAGVGAALHLSLGGWLWLGVAVLLLLLLTPSATALLLLVSARALGMRRVRAVVTAVSVLLGLGITLLAVVGTSRAARTGLLDPARLQAALQGEAAPSSTLSLAREDPAPGLLPSAWASALLEDSAGGHALGRDGLMGLLSLTALTALLAGGCLLVGPSVLASEAFLEPETGTGRLGRGGRPRLPGLSSPVAGLLWKDLKYIARDLILLGQIGTALILFLVPFLLKITQGTAGGADNDIFGYGALVMLLVIVYMATSIISLTSVGLEGRGGWTVLASPVARGTFLRAKWLLSFGLSWGTVLILTLIAWPAFGLGLPLVLESLAVYLCACFALSGVGVGLAGLFPRFVYENPAHRASVWALTLGFVFGTSYLVLCGLLASLAYLGVTHGGLPVGSVLMLSVSAFVLLSLLTGLVPVALATRRLRDYEWE